MAERLRRAEEQARKSPDEHRLPAPRKKSTTSASD
jgi:hypothetical protein